MARRGRDLRPPARAVRLLERGRADGRARRPAAAVARRAALRPRRRSTRSPTPALGLLLVCLMLSYSRGALLALGARAGVVVRARAAAAARRGAAARRRRRRRPVVALGVRAGRAHRPTGSPLAARADAGHELGAAAAARCVVAARRAGLAVGFAAPRRPPSPRARRLAGRGLVARAGADRRRAAARRSRARPAASTGRSPTAGTSSPTPTRRRPRTRPNRLTATALGARALLGRGVRRPRDAPGVGAGAGAYATARTRFRDGDLDGPPRARLRRPDARRPRLVGLALSLLAARRLAASPRRARPGLRRARPRAAVGRRARRAADAGRGRARLRRALADRLDVVRARQRRSSALLCAGWVAGRGPLRELRAPDTPAAPRSAPARGGAAAPRPARRRWRCSALAARDELGGAAAAARGACGGRGDRRARARRLRRGGARTRARAAKRNPLSVDPLWQLAVIADARGDTQRREARRSSERRAPARERRGVAAAGPLPALGARRPGAGASGVPARVLPRSRALDSPSDVLEASRALKAQGDASGFLDAPQSGIRSVRKGRAPGAAWDGSGDGDGVLVAGAIALAAAQTRAGRATVRLPAVPASWCRRSPSRAAGRSAPRCRRCPSPPAAGHRPAGPSAGLGPAGPAPGVPPCRSPGGTNPLSNTPAPTRSRRGSARASPVGPPSGAQLPPAAPSPRAIARRPAARDPARAPR